MVLLVLHNEEEDFFWNVTSRNPLPKVVSIFGLLLSLIMVLGVYDYIDCKTQP